MPIRMRLVSVIALAMTTLVIAGSIGIHSVITNSINASIDQGLKARVDDLKATVIAKGGRNPTIPPRSLVSEESSFAQILNPDGSIITSSERFVGEPVLTAKQTRRALTTPVKFEKFDDGRQAAVRVLASKSSAAGKPVVIAVGTSLALRQRTLNDLTDWLYIGGSLGILLATLIGYFTSRHALGAMDRIRLAADDIDHRSLGSRIPLPAADDEMRALATTLNELLARIDAAFERERRFVAEASHELRTPVALLKTELELALLDPYDADDLETARRRIDALRTRVASAESEADRLSQLATSLLIVAREDATADSPRQLELATAAVELPPLLAIVRSRFEVRATRDDRTIDVTCDEAVRKSTFQLDTIRIEQALSNLIDNALRYGQGQITIAAYTEPAGILCLTVTDEGNGISIEDRPTAFERFVRGSTPDGQSSGSGLGLTIVRMIATAHGGTATVNDDGFVLITLPSPRRQTAPVSSQP